MDSNHDYRLKDKDKWTKKEFEKIFPYSQLIWPKTGILSIKSAPTMLIRLHVTVRTPFDGIILEGMINKLARKNLAKYFEHETFYVSDEQYDDFWNSGTFLQRHIPDEYMLAPRRLTLNLNTDKMSELKEILSDLNNAKEKITEFTKINGVGTKKRFERITREYQTFLETSWYADKDVFTDYGSHCHHETLSESDKDVILPVVEKYLEFIDPKYLQFDLEKVDFFFSTRLEGKVGNIIHKRITTYRENKLLK